MRSLKSWLSVVVVAFLVSLVPAVAIGETIDVKNYSGVMGSRPFEILLRTSGGGQEALAGSMHILALSIVVAGIAIGAGLFFGLGGKLNSGKAS